MMVEDMFQFTLAKIWLGIDWEHSHQLGLFVDMLVGVKDQVGQEDKG